jgi:hypothetical protein
VRTGQTFRVVLRQVVNTPAARPRPPVPVPPPTIERRRRAGAPAELAAAIIQRPVKSRHIVGAFQFSVLVQTRPQILPIVERAAVNLRRVIDTIPHENRWFPVIQRYLSQVTGKVKALGGRDERRDERARFEGKIAGICFDRFGDFEGFWLDTEDGKRSFHSREKEVEELVREAWTGRIAVMVFVEREDRDEVNSIVLLRPPASF